MKDGSSIFIYESARESRQAKGDGSYLTTYFNTDVVIVKCDKTGKIMWANKFLKNQTSHSLINLNSIACLVSDDSITIYFNDNIENYDADFKKNDTKDFKSKMDGFVKWTLGEDMSFSELKINSKTGEYDMKMKIKYLKGVTSFPMLFFSAQQNSELMISFYSEGKFKMAMFK
jgi:hypothetical protein